MPFTFLTQSGNAIVLDEDKPADGMQALKAHIDAEVQSATEPIEAERDAEKSRATLLAGEVIDDVIRMRKLANSDLNVEDERKHLETFSAEQLVAERKRELARFKAPTKSTTETEPEDPKTDDPKEEENEFMPA